jgi:hypothetical protein
MILRTGDIVKEWLNDGMKATANLRAATGKSVDLKPLPIYTEWPLPT